MIKTLTMLVAAATIGIGIPAPSKASARVLHYPQERPNVGRSYGLQRVRFGCAASKMPPRAKKDCAKISSWTGPPKTDCRLSVITECVGICPA